MLSTISAAAHAVPSTSELMFGDFAAENAATRRMIEGYPDGNGQWRPHHRCRTLAELATHVADILNRGTLVLETDGMDIAGGTPRSPMYSRREILAHFESGLTRFEAALSATTPEKLAEPWEMRMGEQRLVKHPRRVLLRLLMMSHLVHHRSQLGLYYRLLGVAVPGMYGPSADDAA